MAIGAVVTLSSVAGAQPNVAGPVLLADPHADPLSFSWMNGVAYGANEYVAILNMPDGVAIRRFDPSGAPLGDSVTYVGDRSSALAIAFDGTRFRAFWASPVQGLGAAVITPDAKLASASSVAQTTSLSQPTAACSPTGECAVIAMAGGSVVGVRFDAAGDAIDAAPRVLVPAPDSAASELAFVHATHITAGYLVTWQIDAGPVVAQVFDASLAPQGTPKTVAPAGNYSCALGGREDAALLACGGQMLPAPASAVRFDGTGAVIDATPIALGTTGALAGAAATSYGFAVLTNGVPPGFPNLADASVIRIDSAGHVQPPTPIPVQPGAAGPFYMSSFASDGSKVFILASTGPATSGSSGTYATYRTTVDAAGAISAITPSLGNVYEAQLFPDVSWDGTGFLTAWTRSAPHQVERARVRLDGSREPLAPYQTDAMQTDGSSYLALASNGTGYAVVTYGHGGTSLAIAPDTASTPPNATIEPWGDNLRGDVGMASDGKGYLAVVGTLSNTPDRAWLTKGLFADAKGNVLPPVDIGASNTYVGNSSVAWNGSTYVVTWLFYDETVDAGHDGQDGLASFYAADGTPVAKSVAVTNGDADVGAVSVACAPGSCVFAWSAHAGIFTRRFDASGVPAGAATLLDGTSGFSAPRLAWDGKEYVLAAAAANVAPHDLVARWLDVDGKPLASDFTSLAVNALSSTTPIRLASDGARHTLVAYTRFDDQRAAGYLLSAPSDVEPDAGSSPEPSPEAGPRDAGTDASSPPSEGGAMDSGGCGCAVAGEPATTLPFGASLLLWLVAFRRRTKAKAAGEKGAR